MTTYIIHILSYPIISNQLRYSYPIIYISYFIISYPTNQNIAYELSSNLK